jgi:hypothetical protein
MLNGDADVELIRRIKKGEVNAFGELVEKHQSLVINFCYRMLGNREDAEDIAQESVCGDPELSTQSQVLDMAPDDREESDAEPAAQQTETGAVRQFDRTV